MTSESSVTKINAVIGIIAGAIVLLTWLTGFSNVPEIVFGKEGIKELPLKSVSEEAPTQYTEIAALKQQISFLHERLDSSKHGITIPKDTTAILQNDKSTCKLSGKKYTGAKPNEYISFIEYSQNSYLIELGLYIDDAKGVITQTMPGRYKVVSGNLTGFIIVSSDCKTVTGEVDIAEGHRKFTYYNVTQ